MQPARLDATAFPHIFERVIAHAPYEVLLRLRLVDRASLELADSVLFRHVAFSHKDGMVNDLRTPRKEKGHHSPLYARSLSVQPPSLGRLPVRPLMTGTFGALIIPPHKGWAQTRVLDFETAVYVREHFEDRPEFPVLHTVRRRVLMSDPWLTDTFVDVVRVPSPGQYDSHVNTLPRGVKRHVVLVLYDPSWGGLEAPFKVNVPFWDIDVHAVFIFRPCPRDERFLAPRFPRQDGNSTKTFLRCFFSLIAHRYHASYTLVGLENVPLCILAAELDLSSEDLLVAAGYQSTGDHDHWAGVVNERTIEAIRALPTDVYEFLCDGEELPEVDDIVEVVTSNQYRSRVGEDVWVCESFGDALPVPLGSGPGEL